jgi:hypothetical protein
MLVLLRLGLARRRHHRHQVQEDHDVAAEGWGMQRRTTSMYVHSSWWVSQKKMPTVIKVQNKRTRHDSF